MLRCGEQKTHMSDNPGVCYVLIFPRRVFAFTMPARRFVPYLRTFTRSAMGRTLALLVAAVCAAARLAAGDSHSEPHSESHHAEEVESEYVPARRCDSRERGSRLIVSRVLLVLAAAGTRTGSFSAPLCQQCLTSPLCAKSLVPTAFGSRTSWWGP